MIGGSASSSEGRRAETARGQSSPLGVTLVFGIMLAGAIVIVVFGAAAINDARDTLSNQRAEKVMTELDSEVALVALGRTDSQQVSFSRTSGEQFTVDNSSGWLRVNVTNTSTNTERTLVNESLGAVIYENGGAEIAYQGGGVWRFEDGRSVMVSPPEFHYRNATLTLPLVTISGDSSLGSRASISKNGSSEPVFPDRSANDDWVNPLQNSEVTITVHSDYYRAWGSYFEARTTGGVTYDHAKETVTLRLLKQQQTRTVSQALAISSGSDGTLRIQAGAFSTVDSYNSSTISPNRKSRPAGGGGNGDVVTSLNVNFNGNAEIHGNLTTDGTVSFAGSPGPPYRVGGHLRYGEGTVSGSDCTRYVGNWCAKNASMGATPDIENQISQTITDLQGSNDNAGDPCISAADALKYGTGPCAADEITLEAGDYYVANQDLSVNTGQKLLLNTTNGDIRIALDNDRQLAVNRGNVTVVGDGRVEIYATKQTQITGTGAKVWNRGWDSRQFWLYCDAECQTQITQHAVFNGVIYAPPGPGGTAGHIDIGQQAEVYGAIVSGGGSHAELDSNSEIYFDQNLRTASVFQQATVPSLSYLHVSVNRVNVTG